MNEKEYLEKAKRTLSTNEDILEHMAYGLITESGEIMDALKKHKFYGRTLDVQNLKEEAGDLMWYLYQFLEQIGYSPEQCRADNIEKLSKRYPDKFTDIINRRVEQELSHIDKSIGQEETEDLPISTIGSEEIVNEISFKKIHKENLYETIEIDLKNKCEMKRIRLTAIEPRVSAIITSIEHFAYHGMPIDDAINLIFIEAGLIQN